MHKFVSLFKKKNQIRKFPDISDNRRRFRVWVNSLRQVIKPKTQKAWSLQSGPIKN